MNQTRKMWASAAVVGVVLVGGVSVTAAASAGRLDQARGEMRAVVEMGEKAPPAQGPVTRSGPEGGAGDGTEDGIVVSKDVNPDPGEVVDYWTDKRMEDAQPMPMPEVGQGEFDVAD
ncbi:hypothetical protein OIE66_19920 [Nonomuraea sp. NBC_01738]|uniref:hypothetical protein n=1 Tax=Nonomuraea sp. NBC_01738 TaxID=2976003 RepID=UPI002E0D3754|nr:hypothetical protein OIE66_19920 [Nonomuraea sp. NBC_01738]